MAIEVKKAKKSKKQRKHGRNSDSCKAYASSHRRERNKLVRLKKHLVRFPDDKTALSAVAACKLVVRG